MRKQKRPLLAALLLFLLLFVTACGGQTSSQVEAEAVEHIRDENLDWIRNYSEMQFDQLFQSATYEEFEAYKSTGTSVLFNILFDNDLGERWKTFTDAHGAVVSAKTDEVMREGEEYTSRIILTGEDDAQMALTVFYNAAGQPLRTQIADYSDDSQDTLADKIKTAGANTVTGLLVVFAVLIFLSLVIASFKFVNRAVEAPTKRGTETEAVEAKAPARIADAAEEDDPQIIAAIAAAVAQMGAESGSSYVVRSIRRRNSNSW